MKQKPFYEFQRENPCRDPAWRWRRATALFEFGKYFSKAQDDVGTGAGVFFLREVADCRTQLRLRRVRARYRHLVSAKQIWEEYRTLRRLELESRLLARQNETEIGLAMGLAPEAAQAYENLFFNVCDRLGQVGYITNHVIGLPVGGTPNPITLLKLCAFFHGPEVIGPWLNYLRSGAEAEDLDSKAGRAQATIENFLAVRAMENTDETWRTLRRLIPILTRLGSKRPKPVSARNAFMAATEQQLDDIGFPAAVLPPFSYLPRTPKRLVRRFEPLIREARKAA